MFSRDQAHIAQSPILIGHNAVVKVFVHGQELQGGHVVYGYSSIPPLTAENVFNFVHQVLDFVAKVRQLEICVGAHNPKYQLWWKREQSCFVDDNKFHDTSTQGTPEPCAPTNVISSSRNRPSVAGNAKKL